MPKVINTDIGSSQYSDGSRKFGRVVNAGATQTVVWDGLTPYEGFLPSEEDIQVVSSSTLDTVGGTGCQYVQFTGQGEDGKEKTYSVTLNGTTPVLLSATDPTIKFNCVYTAQCLNVEGTNTSPISGANAGDITISSVTTGKTMALIKQNLGRTQMMVYRMPSDRYGEFEKISIYPDGNRPVLAQLWVRDSIEFSWICVGQIDIDNQVASITHPFPDYISPSTDIMLTVTPEQTGTNISAQWWLKKKKFILED